MTTFALISEGVTDQVVISNVLAGYFDSDDLDINILQPLRSTANESKQEGYGGWLQVFEYCASNKFKEAFQTNDYVIIQVDTDVSEEKGYDISKYENGREVNPEQLIEKVIAKLRGLIGEPFYTENQQRIIFAIAVHSIECWLLPLYYTDNRKAKIKNCLDTLNQELDKRGIRTIKREDKKYKAYNKICFSYCKQKTLISFYQHNPSLKYFIDEQLKPKNIVMEEAG